MTRTMNEFMDGFLEYLELQEKKRNEAVARVLRKLTEREKLLVCEVAVMGYVQGRRDAGNFSIPKDAKIVINVIDACISMADREQGLFVTVAGLAEEPLSTSNPEENE